MENRAHKFILKLEDPDEMFDLICARNYFAGSFMANIPVDESREVFERIKAVLREKYEKGK